MNNNTADLSHWNVIVVDDEPHNLALIEYVFDFYHARVRPASTGKECLQLLQEELPTIVLLDIQMPSMSGEDVLKVIRENAAWRHIKVVAVTAHAMEGDRERFLGVGFDDYLAKPLSPKKLVDFVQGVLDRTVS